MMAPIFKRKKERYSAWTKTQERLAIKIVTTCLRWQSRYALWLQARSEALSGRSKYLLLILFVSVFSGYSFFLVIEGVMGKRSESISTDQSYTTTKGSDTYIDKEQYHKIHSFKIYMDSLARSPTSRYYEYIIMTRPGLMDSINFIDSMYNKKQLKKWNKKHNP